MGGQFATSKRVEIDFKLNEFDEESTIQWEFTVTDQKSSYDMIIGTDLLIVLGIKLDIENRMMTWGHREVPMKSHDATRETSYHVADEGKAASEATERI